MDKDDIKYNARFCPSCGAEFQYHPSNGNLLWCDPDAPCGVMELIPDGVDRFAPLLLWRPRTVSMDEWTCP